MLFSQLNSPYIFVFTLHFSIPIIKIYSICLPNMHLLPFLIALAFTAIAAADVNTVTSTVTVSVTAS